VHRDLTLESFVYDLITKNVLLVDLSHARQLINENEQMSEEFGAPAFLSPEVLKHNSSEIPYMPKPVDVWNCGVIFYTLLFGCLPFYDSEPAILFHKISHGNFQMPYTRRLSSETRSLVQSILSIDPSNRPMIDEVHRNVSEIIAENN
jgi:serine/threonine protein kinase